MSREPSTLEALLAWFAARGGTLVVQRDDTVHLYSLDIHVQATGADRMRALHDVLSEARAISDGRSGGGQS